MFPVFGPYLWAKKQCFFSSENTLLSLKKNGKLLIKKRYRLEKGEQTDKEGRIFPAHCPSNIIRKLGNSR